MKWILCVLSIFLLSSCSTPCHDYAIMGADEFVIDSYKIRQGKLAILELEGIEVEDFPFDAMEEYRDVIAEDDILNIVVITMTMNTIITVTMTSDSQINDILLIVSVCIHTLIFHNIIV